MEQIRKGLTLEYAKEKREKLLAELKSDEHYSQTETVAYGHHDPLSVPVAACDSCHGRAQMQKVIGPPVRWNMVCLVVGRRSNKSRNDRGKQQWRGTKLTWEHRTTDNCPSLDLGVCLLNQQDREWWEYAGTRS